ncbi:hypothetical protein [Dendrosporobacter sp. 1207_IL3150]|uniref:hypothetical protein n=1 Tax=Dendrosporobacter sp. 1207_IL3150 TaxID=3084054 RepID=UPI002FD9BB95
MKRSVLALCLVVILVIGLCSVAYAASHQVLIVNQTGVTIYGLYVSPSASNNWGSNLLDGYLPSGYQIPVVLYGYSSYGWDIMAVDKNGDSIYWRNVDLNNLYKFTLLY